MEVYIGTDLADRKAAAIGGFFEFTWMKEVKWPCPMCGSRFVENYDPGIHRQMRVYCKDVGWYGCRDDSEDDAYIDELREWVEYCEDISV